MSSVPVDVVVVVVVVVIVFDLHGLQLRSRQEVVRALLLSSVLLLLLLASPLCAQRTLQGFVLYTRRKANKNAFMTIYRGKTCCG